MLAATGDRPQLLCAALAIRYGRSWPVAAGLAFAAALCCALASYAGSYLPRYISEEPVRLMFAIALLLAGMGMLLWRRPVELFENWRLGAFGTSLLALLTLIFGDKGQFLLATNSAMTGDWIFAGIGGWLGLLAACLPAIWLQERVGVIVPITWIRRIGGGVFVLLSLIHAAMALGLFG